MRGLGLWGLRKGALLSEDLGTRLSGPRKQRKWSNVDAWIPEGPELDKERCEGPLGPRCPLIQ